MKVSRNAVPVKELLPVRRSAICVVVLVELMLFYYAVNKTFCSRTSARPQKMSEIRCNANG